MFTIAQFTSQALYLIVAIAIGSLFRFNDVQMGMLGQALDTAWSGLAFFLGWKLLKPAPAANTLPEGKRNNSYLLCHSFTQVWHTTKKIHTTFGQSLRPFFLAVVFSEAAANAFTTLSVVFLKDQLYMTGSQVGIFFLCSLIGTIPGAKLASWVTIRLSPPTSWSLSMTFILVVSTAGALTLNRGVNVFITYVWGFLIGVGLGWFYPCERLCFAMLLPQGQEAELSGFNVYCTQILVWLPPLVFSILVQSNIHQKYGLLSIQCFFLVGIAFLFMIRWDAALLQVHGSIPEDGKVPEKTYEAPLPGDESGTIEGFSSTNL
jgi:MFS-type transporter involved in bile tolerance (Atg22 family)